MPVCRRGERRNSQRACGSSPADERQQSKNGFLRTVLILLDSFFLFRLNDYWRKGKQRSTIPHVYHPQKDAGWILCTHRTDMSLRERCVMVWGPVLGGRHVSWLAPESKLLYWSACSCLWYWQHLRLQELWIPTEGKHSSNAFVWLKLRLENQIKQKGQLEEPVTKSIVQRYVLIREITFLVQH